MSLDLTQQDIVLLKQLHNSVALSAVFNAMDKKLFDELKSTTAWDKQKELLALLGVTSLFETTINGVIQEVLNTETPFYQVAE